MTTIESPSKAIVEENEAAIITIGSAQYESSSRMLSISGEAMMLEPRIGDLLLRLVRADGPVTREALLDDIWGDLGSDEALTQAISKLRRALNDTKRPHQIIQTVPKQGYRLGVKASMGRSEALTTSLQPVAGRVGAFVRRNRVFLGGFLAGVVFSIVMAAIFVLFNPGVRELEVICPEGSSPEACAALLNRP